MEIEKNSKRVSMRTLLTLQFIICIIVLFLIQFCIVNIILYPRQAEQEEKLVQSQIEAEAQKIGSMLYQELGEITSLAQSYSLSAMDFSTFRLLLEDYDRQKAEKEGKANIHLVLCNTDKIGFLSKGKILDLSKENFWESLWKQKDKTGVYYIKGLKIEEEVKDYIIVAKLLYDYESKHTGYLLSFTEVNKILSEISFTLFPAEVKLCLTDAKENLLLWGEKEIGTRVIKAVDEINEDKKEKVKELLNQEEENKKLFYFQNQGKSIGTAKIPYTYGWNLHILWNNSGMETNAEQYQLYSWLLWAVLVSILTATALCVNANVILPMEKVTKAILEVDEKGKKRIHQHFFIREIEQLGQSVNSMQKKISELFDTMAKEEEGKRIIERKMLQAQITPHFLYNTLDNISWRAISCGNCQIPDIVSALSSFFHISLSDGREFITWNEEAEHAYSYLFIQQMRYEDKLDFEVDLDPEIMQYSVIKLLLQPLVENSLYHGIKLREGRGMIKIKIEPVENDKIQVKIQDNGAGMTKKRLEEVRMGLEGSACIVGFGLGATVQRLRLTYGDNCKFTIQSEEEIGTEITILLPREERKEYGRCVDRR